MDLLKEFKKNWEKKGFASAEQTLLLAVSGGVDSMVMAELFLKAGLSFAVAHCNFQLRAEEADKDEEHVRDWCAKNNILLHHVRFDTKEKTEEWKKGVQETARILRYEWLDEVREANKYAAIVTAHHANDNAETLLINLFKGTGIAGLHGIQPRNGNIIRPLLFAERTDIESFAKEHNITWREDASNASDNYLRNAVRHHIVPAADKWFPNVVQHVNGSIQRFAEAEIIYKRGIEQERKKLVEKRGSDFYVAVKKLVKRTPLETLCYELFTPYGITAAQVPQVLQLLSSESGHFIETGSHKIIRDRDFIIVTASQSKDAGFITIDGVPCSIETESGHFHFSVEKKPKTITADSNTACIDMKRISFPLIVRRWKQGDYFYPFGMGMKKKKLSKFFIDQKLPIHLKEHTWIVECDRRIAWVAGMRLDERFKVKDDTAQVLRIEFKPR